MVRGFGVGSAFEPLHGSGGGGGGDVSSVFGRTGDVAALVADYAGLYVRVAAADSITAQHTFAPGAAAAPYLLNANAQGQLVTGLNADKLDGLDSSAFALAVHTHDAADIVTGQLSKARGGTGVDLSATGGAGQVLKQTSAGGAITVATLAFSELAGSATLAQLPTIADQTILGNNTGGTAVPLALTAAQTRTLLALVVGTNVQAFNSNLASLAGLTLAADKGLYATGAATLAQFDLSAAARTVLDDATVGAMVDTLGGAAATGTGGLARATSPTFVTPLLGTPTSGTLTNCTGLPEGGLALTDITTANVSTTKHGFAPKLPNDATKYLDGTGAYSVPAGGGGGGGWTDDGTVVRLTTSTDQVGIGTASPVYNSALTVIKTVPDPASNTSSGIHCDITTAGSSTAGYIVTAANFWLEAGYGGATTTVGVYAYNGVAGTGNDPFNSTANMGIRCEAQKATSGAMIAYYGDARSSTAINYAAFLKAVASNSGSNIGCAGFALNSSGTANVGGFFGLMSATPTYATAALMCDNGSQAADILVIRDNGTAKVTFADGGHQTFADAVNIIVNATTGTKIGTATTQKLGFWNVAPVAQYSTTGTTTGFTANASANAVFNESTFTGNTGSTAYTVSDLVRALKLCGIILA